MLRSFVGAVALILAPFASAGAQTAPAAVAAPEPARLAAAQTLIAKVMPADRRDAMVDQMIRPMIENMRETLLKGPQFESLRAENPEFGPAFDKFVASELEHTLATTKAAMPALTEAMARAYARQFTLAQLQAINAFFDTPAGQAFAQNAPALMSDPDILAAQSAMMNQAMAGMAQRIESFAAKAAEAGKKAN